MASRSKAYPSASSFAHLVIYTRVFRAVDVKNHQIAACKLIYITDKTTEKDRKTVDKEMKIHAALKHRNVLEFISAVIVELKYQHLYVPGIYMLLEFAAGGDLFDKIGECDVKWLRHNALRSATAPDVGTGEDVAHLYFKQLVDGMARPLLCRVRSRHLPDVA